MLEKRSTRLQRRVSRVVRRALPIVTLSLLTGCNSTRDDYEEAWAKIPQPNRPLKYVQPDEDGNLFQSQAFTSGAALVVSDALTTELKTQMQRHGLQPNLAGYIELMTAKLPPPDETPSDVLERSTWILGTRAFLWGGFFDNEADKSAEIHLSSTGARILVLREGSRDSGPFYAERNGVMGEYYFTSDGRSGSAVVK